MGRSTPAWKFTGFLASSSLMIRVTVSVRMSRVFRTVAGPMKRASGVRRRSCCAPSSMMMLRARQPCTAPSLVTNSSISRSRRVREPWIAQYIGGELVRQDCVIVGARGDASLAKRATGVIGRIWGEQFECGHGVRHDREIAPIGQQRMTSSKSSPGSSSL